MKMKEEIEGDMSISGDKRAMKVVRDIANSIQPSIELEVDYPSSYEGGKMPLLNLKMLNQSDGGGVL